MVGFYGRFILVKNLAICDICTNSMHHINFKLLLQTNTIDFFTQFIRTKNDQFCKYFHNLLIPEPTALMVPNREKYAL